VTIHENWIGDYTSQIAIVGRLVSSVTLPGNGFNVGNSSVPGLKSSQVGICLTRLGVTTKRLTTEEALPPPTTPPGAAACNDLRWSL
jgi:hypothetical protein